MVALESTDNTITVIGTGRADVVPDVLLVNLAAVGGGGDVAAALDAASAATTAVLRALAGAGVDAADVATADLSVSSRWAPDGTRMTGYDCTQSLSVVLRDLAASGRILRDVATAAGSALQVNGVSRSVSEPTAAQAAARADAFADAASKAGQLAELAGRRLGAILVIDETVRGGDHRAGWRAQKAIALGGGPQVPIEAGRQRIETSLMVRWTLLG